MQIDAYLRHWHAFCQEFGISEEPQARLDKLVIEMCELLELDADVNDEALDVMICAIALVVSRGYSDPLHACFLKLERTSEKYRKNGVTAVN